MTIPTDNLILDYDPSVVFAGLAEGDPIPSTLEVYGDPGWVALGYSGLGALHHWEASPLLSEPATAIGASANLNTAFPTATLTTVQDSDVIDGGNSIHLSGGWRALSVSGEVEYGDTLLDYISDSIPVVEGEQIIGVWHAFRTNFAVGVGEIIWYDGNQAELARESLPDQRSQAHGTRYKDHARYFAFTVPAGAATTAIRITITAGTSSYTLTGDEVVAAVGDLLVHRLPVPWDHSSDNFATMNEMVYRRAFGDRWAATAVGGAIWEGGKVLPLGHWASRISVHIRSSAPPSVSLPISSIAVFDVTADPPQPLTADPSQATGTFDVFPDGSGASNGVNAGTDYIMSEPSGGESWSLGYALSAESYDFDAGGEWGDAPLPVGMHAVAKVISASGEISTYLDGSLLSSVTPSDSMAYAIGNTLGVELGGEVDVPRLLVWNRALTPQEVASISAELVSLPTWTLSWGTPSSDGGSAVTGYRVRVAAGSAINTYETTQTTLQVEAPTGALAHVVALNAAGESTPVEIALTAGP